MSCEFTVDLRIIAADGVTVRASLNDEAAGYRLIGEVGEPEWQEDDGPVTSPYMHGDGPSRLPTMSVGFLPAVVAVKGSTWAGSMQQRDTLEAAWRAEPSFFVEREVEGVTTRWRARRSLWRPEPITSTVIAAREQEVSLVFRVQPLPSVVYA